jgi:hypothetical protein
LLFFLVFLICIQNLRTCIFPPKLANISLSAFPGNKSNVNGIQRRMQRLPPRKTPQKHKNTIISLNSPFIFSLFSPFFWYFFGAFVRRCKDSASKRVAGTFSARNAPANCLLQVTAAPFGNLFPN